MIKWKFLKVKIKKLNTLESIGEFIDLLTFYHLSKCVFKDCSNCRFIDRITQIYILFYPNYEREEENGSVVVKKLQKYFFKYFGNFYSLYIFLESIHILHEHEEHIENKKKNFQCGTVYLIEMILCNFFLFLFFSTLEKKQLHSKDVY